MVNLCRESYISGRMLNTFSYGSGLSQLLKRDNLHIKDKRPAPNLSIIQKFYFIYIIGFLIILLIPTPLVLALFLQLHPYIHVLLCSFKKISLVLFYI